MKPLLSLAAVWHNYEWFAERVFGEAIEMPGLGSEKDEEGGDEAADETEKD